MSAESVARALMAMDDGRLRAAVADGDFDQFDVSDFQVTDLDDDERRLLHARRGARRMFSRSAGSVRSPRRRCRSARISRS